MALIAVASIADREFGGFDRGPAVDAREGDMRLEDDLREQLRGNGHGYHHHVVPVQCCCLVQQVMTAEASQLAQRQPLDASV